MKKYLFLIGVVLATLSFGTTSQAQGPAPCIGQLNEFFHKEVVKATPANAKPKVLNRLGSNPQFGRIKKHTAASAYAHLKGVKKRSRTKGAELDRLLRTLGYSGIEDKEFTAEDITAVMVPKGSTGWMGSGSKKYIKATFGRDFEGYKIFVKDSPCFVYIMKTCGNIFYVDPPSCDGNEYPCPECVNAASFKGKINPFCNCTPCPECQTTVDQTINLVGDGKITSGNLLKSEQEITLVASYGGENLCLGTMTVPVNVAYEYSATGSTSASETVKIDNQDGNAQSSKELKIPVKLDFDINNSQMAFGDNGVVRMDVTAKRFKALKKMYEVCPAEISPTPMESLVAVAPEMEGVTIPQNTAGDSKSGLKKQTLNFMGSGAVSDISSKSHSNTVTVIAHSTKTTKLANGESPERYLCLGQYSVPGTSELAYLLKGNSELTESVEVCDAEGTEPAVKNIELPIDLAASFTKQDMKVGDDGKIYIEITEQQYKKFAKKFSRCCSNGDTSCL